MPYGGNDWLALTREPILEPELPICDPHHHFWDLRNTRIPYQRYLLLGARVAPVIEALQAASANRFRGIRHSVTFDPHPEVENTAAHRMQGQLANAEFRAGARVLARMGMSLEAWLFFPQLPELADF